MKGITEVGQTKTRRDQQNNEKHEKDTEKKPHCRRLMRRRWKNGRKCQCVVLQALALLELTSSLFVVVGFFWEGDSDGSKRLFV